MKTQGPIILAFSGGLDTTAIALWLKEKFDREIIGYCAALGNAESPEKIEKRAQNGHFQAGPGPGPEGPAPSK